MGWHQRWRADTKLTPTDAGVQTHELCCRVLHTMCVYDQINAGNLASAEHCARLLQLVEERWKSRVMGAADAEAVQDAHLYAGTATR